MNLMDQVWFHQFVTWWIMCGLVYAILIVIGLNTTDTAIRDKHSITFLTIVTIICIASGMIGFGYGLYCFIKDAINSLRGK